MSPKQPRQTGADVNYEKPTHAEIAALAYSLWQESGSTDGHDLDDWLTAEKILEGEIDKEVS